MPDNAADEQDSRDWNRERAQIIRFFEDLREVVNGVPLEAQDGDYSARHDAEELRQLREARDDLQGAFDDAVAGLLDDRPERSVYARVGLRGKQLALKLAGWTRVLRDYMREKSKKALRPLLKWANILLGSLASVLPPAEIIKEYKEVLEESIWPTQ